MIVTVYIVKIGNYSMIADKDGTHEWRTEAEAQAIIDKYYVYKKYQRRWRIVSMRVWREVKK